jgi:isoquinoline 1-oxidoreductase subunit beta
VSPAGEIEVLSNTSEIGQGTGTAIAQILAEELDVEWQAIRLAVAPIDPQFFNPLWNEYATYGSGGIRGQFDALRRAGAQARQMLVNAAAAKWNVTVTECDTERGSVVHRASGRRCDFGALAAAASRGPVPQNPSLKPPEKWKLIGAEIKRLDIPAKVNGTAIYGIDVKLPGLLIAAIRQAPRFGGRLSSVDPNPALTMRGVRRVVPLDNAVAVIAADYWTASQALLRLEPLWDESMASTANSPDYSRSLRDAVRRGGTVFAPSGSTAPELTQTYETAMRAATTRIEATYTVPFLSHATMEPMNATALVSSTHATLWLPTQNPSAATKAVAKALELPASAITIHTTLSGGGFGRRIEFDFAVQAALIAKAVAEPVKLIWSREEDMRHDFYRPAAALRIQAGIGADGWPVGMRCDRACESLLYYSNGGNRAAALPVDWTAVGARPSYYDLGPTLFAVTTLDVGVPVGFWRSVAASQNMFAYESFFDELAHAGGADPAAWRRHLLGKSSRELRVLDAVLERTRWATPAPAGRFRGLALAKANGSIVANVVEISVNDETRISIHRVTTAIDCGIVINPNSVRAQVEGCVGFALSATMYGEISLKNGAVEQSNFHDYRPVRMHEMPPIEVMILPSREAPGGAGEEAVSPFAPALANALYAATGRRIRDLPLARSGLTLS